MALVASHQIRIFTSPVNTNGAIDANMVRGNDNVMRSAYVAHDADATIHVQSSTLAAQPAAGTEGRSWITDDGTTVVHWYDDGTNWVELASSAPYAVVDDSITAPSAISGKALIYVDAADGDLKVKFGDGTVKTIATNP